jgi:predicted Rossmann-fold nucleotide-binding protein
MRVIVCGGRAYADKAKVATILYKVCGVRSHDDAIIVHGAAPGADTLAAEAAEGWGLTVEAHPPNVRRYGSPAAFHVRNQKMVDAGADVCVAFPGGKGTADCVRRARAAGIPVVTVGDG